VNNPLLTLDRIFHLRLHVSPTLVVCDIVFALNLAIYPWYMYIYYNKYKQVHASEDRTTNISSLNSLHYLEHLKV
jgi:hypothetical protein